MKQEAASHALEQYYSLSEFDRPQTEQDFDALLYKKAIEFMAKETKQYLTEHGGDDAIRSAMARNGYEDQDPLEWLTTCTSAPQDMRMEAMEAVNTLSELPPRLKQIAQKMGSGANVIECAREMKVSIPEAISMQSAARFLAQAFDEEGER